MQYFKKMAEISIDTVFSLIWIMFYWHILKFVFQAVVFCGPPMVNGYFNMYLFVGWLFIFGIIYFRYCIGSLKEFFVSRIPLAERLWLLIQSGIMMLAFLLAGALLYWICTISGEWGTAKFIWCDTSAHRDFLLSLGE